MKRKCFILILLVLPFCTFAQHKKAKEKDSKWKTLVTAFDQIFNAHDTTFIKKVSFDYRASIINSNWLDLYSVRNDNAEIGLQSDLSYNLGASLGYKMFQLSYLVNLNNLISDTKKKRTELGFNIATNLASVEVYFYNNKGLSNVVSYESDSISLDLNTPLKEMSTQVFGFDAYYYFNNKKYSNSAAYTNSYNYNQLKSAGSLITGFSFADQSFSFDFSELEDNDQFSGINGLDLQENAFTTYFLTIGYGYNFAFSQKWLLNLTLLPSVGLKTDKNQQHQENLQYSMRNKMKMAVVYNFSKFYTGLNCQYSANFDFSDAPGTSSSLGIFNIVSGFRF